METDADQFERDDWEHEDEAEEIRFSLTALGETYLDRRRGATRPKRFYGFGPCPMAVA